MAFSVLQAEDLWCGTLGTGTLRMLISMYEVDGDSTFAVCALYLTSFHTFIPDVSCLSGTVLHRSQRDERRPLRVGDAPQAGDV